MRVIPIVATITALFAHGCQQSAPEVGMAQPDVPPAPEPWKNTSFKPPRADSPAYRYNIQIPGHYALRYLYSGRDGVDLKQELVSYSLDGRTGGEPGQVSLLAFPTEHIMHQEHSEDIGHRGIALRLINRTKLPVLVEYCDSDLFIVQEAYSDIGGWTPIESFVQSFCGNSYGMAELPANSYWEFAAPEYDGSIQTRMRFRCVMSDGWNEQPWSIYSNEFIGRVNPEQFIEKPRR